MKKIIAFVVVLSLTASGAFAQELLNLIKKDLNKEKRSLVAEAMDIKKENETAFWNLYSAYEAENDKLIDNRAANIKKFADNYETLTPEVADELAKTALKVQADRAKINAAYYKKMSKVVGNIQAARFIQVMNQVQLVLDIQVASEIPLIE